MPTDALDAFLVVGVALWTLGVRRRGDPIGVRWSAPGLLLSAVGAAGLLLVRCG